MKSAKKIKERPSLLDEQKNVCKKIGNRIRELRKAKGYSQEKFALTFDIDRTLQGRIERGTNLEINTLVKVLYALDISIQDFFTGME